MRALLLALTLAVVGASRPHADQAAPVTFIAAEEVSAAFEKGRPLVETGEFKIHASRRDAAGMAEVHVRDTDVIHVLQGRATVVTGGTVVAPRTVAPDEIRGASLEGGDARPLAAGDVMVIPNGVPHWFRQVDGPLLYYVVKVTAPGGTR